MTHGNLQATRHIAFSSGTGAASRYVASLAVTAQPRGSQERGSGPDGIGLVSRSANARVRRASRGIRTGG
jgi:hypothetical protein